MFNNKKKASTIKHFFVQYSCFRGKDYLYFQENNKVIPDSSTGKPKPATAQTLAENSHAPVDLLSGKPH